MAPLVPIIASAIPSIINLFTGETSRTDSVVNLAKQAGELLELGTETTADQVIKHLNSNPEAVVKLKELEIQARALELDSIVKAKQAELDELTVRINDIQNARSRQIEHEKATGKSDINLYVLAWLTVLGFFILIGILLWAPLPKGSENIVYLLLGCLTANTNSVYQYFFGSSKGSADKTIELTKVSKGNRAA